MSSVDAVAEILTFLNRNDFASADIGAPLHAQDEQIHARYANLTLTSRFQPIFALSDDSIVAHEAFLQAQSGGASTALGTAFSPETIFFIPGQVEEITHLDRLTRTLHTLNFLVQGSTGNLHLNVHAHHLLAVHSDHGKIFEGILQQCGLAPGNIVLEVVEDEIREKSRLAAAIAAWQSRGYRMAIDKFGRNHLHLERVLRLKPDLIKVDRSLLEKCSGHPQRLHSLAALIDNAHAAGVQVAVAGIETAAQLAAVRRAGADYGQGYLLGKPAQHCLDSRPLPHPRDAAGGRQPSPFSHNLA